MHAIALGSGGNFMPLNMVTQIQSSNLVQRTAGVSATFGETVEAPSVTSITPIGGTADGGTTVTIYGANFTSDAAVYFGSTLVDSDDIEVVSATKLTVVVPDGTIDTTARVKVINDYGTSPNTSADDFAFDRPTYTITSSLNDDSYGSISPVGTVSVDWGDDESFTITAATGYHIAGLVVDGVTTSAAAGETVYTHAFTDVTEDHTIEVTFEADTD